MTERQKPIEERFTIALSELIGMCLDANMHPSEMIGPMKAELLWLRQASMPTKFDDKYNAERGFPPMTEAQIRESLKLEPYEPIPPQRDDN